jgi:hypothetical protein
MNAEIAEVVAAWNNGDTDQARMGRAIRALIRKQNCQECGNRDRVTLFCGRFLCWRCVDDDMTAKAGWVDP